MNKVIHWLFAILFGAVAIVEAQQPAKIPPDRTCTRGRQSQHTFPGVLVEAFRGRVARGWLHRGKKHYH